MRKVFTFLALMLLGLAIITVYNWGKINRLMIVNSFFEAEKIVDNFQDVDEIFPHTHITASSRPLILAEKLDFSFPETFFHNNETYNTQDFLNDTRTEGLLVILRDTIVMENYYLGLEKDEQHISWSMAKSFIGTLVGVAVEQGKLKLEDKVESLLPEFEGTGYEGVTVLDLLGMRSGVRFNEDYGDFNSDINRFGRAFALGTSYREFAQSLTNEVPPGSVCRYVSLDTQLLGFLVSKAMGQSITDLLQNYIWEPAGMEYGAGWITDNEGEELSLGGLTATLRDYAKLGLLYKHQGYINNRQIVDSTWIKSATSRHPSDIGNNNLIGYGYQWWIPPHNDGDFLAVGIYDQFVYVHPEKDIIICKLSADHRFKTDGPAIKAQHISFFQHVAKSIG